MKSTNFLSQEHDLILRALNVLDTVCALAKRSATLNHTDVIAIVDFLRYIGEEQHQAKEEMIFFPALKSAAVRQNRPIQQLTLDHQRERALIEQLEAALRMSRIPEFVPCATKISAMLRNHIYEEEHGLFESAREVLNAGEDDVTVYKLSQFGSQLERQRASILLENL